MLKFRHIGRTGIAVLAAAIIMLAASPAGALDSEKSVKQYVPRLFTVADGLPQPWIQTIVQTRDGYLWFGTQEGLARFNGAQFTNFDKNNTPGINHNNIRALLEDKQSGALWMGTYGGGLTRYDGGKFKTFTVDDGLPGNFVLTLVQAPAGEVWIGTDKGLAIYKDEKIKEFKWPDEDIRQPVSGLATSFDGSIWFLIRNRVYQIDSRKNVHRIAENIPEPRAIYADRDGSLWIGTMTHGVYKWSAGKSTHYSDQSGLPKAPIRALYQDKAGKIWAAAYSVGLCRLESHETFECYTTKDGLMEASIVSLYEDHEGDLWLGTESNGTIRLRDTNFAIYDKRLGLADNYVLGIFQSKDGTVWVGTRPGLNRIKDGKITPIRISTSLPGNTVAVIEEAGNGDLWIGTEEGLKLLRGEKVVRSFTTHDGMATNDIHALLRDHEGSLWIGDRTGGLTRYKNGKFTRFTQKDGLVSTRVRNIHEDYEGNIWFSTEEGLTRFKDDRFTNFALEKGKGGATGGAVSVYEDKNHVFWIGTYGSGLIRFQDGKFVSFNTKDGLFDDSIWSVVEDDSGNLWMSSNRGLFRARRSDLNEFAAGKTAKIPCTAYGTSDGLLTTDFNGGEQATGWKTQQGKLLFATSIGLVEVDPRHLRKNPLPPPVVIEDALVDKASILNQQSAPIRRGELEFHFAGLSFVCPEKVALKYKLEGYDKDWTFSGTRRVAYYTNLPPGPYQFRVLAANNDGVWNDNGASFDLYLKPHFYQTIWFDLLCGLSVLLIAAGAYRLRIRQLRKRQEELVALVDGRTKELQEEVVQRRKTEQQLQEHVVERNRATEKAEGAARAKGEFLANMSHEIRTPLNGVIGTLDLTAQTELTAEQKELLQMCRSSADSLLVVLNDILDFSKIEAGKLHFEEKQFQIADTLAEAARTIAVRAHQKKLELAYFVDQGVPACVEGDSARLKQVLMNLLGNAVKFTDKGEVLLRVQVEEQDADGVHLKFSVSDTGIGIPVDKQQAIFEAFSQADTSVTRRFGGTGLGLAISARIVNLMGGCMWVESSPGKGSTFYFTASFKVGTGLQALDFDRVSAALYGYRALVVDDNQTNCWIVEQTLSNWGMQVTCAASAQEALRALKLAARKGQPFQLLISDSTMPEMDGFEFVEEIKREPGPLPKTIMMLTSDDYTATAARCRQLEIESNLIKPVRQSDLLAAIRNLLQSGKSTRPEWAARVDEHSKATTRLRILLAEDNLVNQKLAVRMLQKMGHEVAVAENGKLAVEQLQKDEFDLVFMDVHMPEMDGYAATQAIREWESKHGGHIPIVAMTANAMAGDRDKCLEHGMDGYVAKPIRIEDLARAIQLAFNTATEEHLIAKNTHNVLPSPAYINGVTHMD